MVTTPAPPSFGVVMTSRLPSANTSPGDTLPIPWGDRVDELGPGRVGGIDNVKAVRGRSDVDVIALPGNAPDPAVDVAVVGSRQLKRTQQLRLAHVVDTPEIDSAPGDSHQKHTAVRELGIRDLMRFGVAETVRT